MQLLDYVQNNMNNIIRLTIEHLQITGISIITAIVIGVPLGIIVTRYKRLADPILATANIFQTIPSIAFFGILIPFMGIGKETAILVLFLYALLPIIKNTYTGINEVSSSLIDAGRGMGMTNFQILRMVELPQSLAVIMAGVRIATVINIGSATIAAYIGAGGLGELIFKGIQMYRNDMILVGAILAALLAVVADKLLGYVEHKLTPRGMK
ncbi:MAG TPA: ABC transporter permease [Sedimentibacter sp.]|jgi:osmoprotectant transport system permease protein|nr:ABC transporter permease [Spirochaetota bacterium]HPV84746.1 ABC transporter permease [Sedimentibacter sp.]HPY55925.1 ABC transporter permease [Sedimentibacter sp.]HQC69418.1 ABC transporter permease [Sedimentibacter sp.]HQO71253.1 ABC transporter permease [Sedimentibacter sp.]